LALISAAKKNLTFIDFVQDDSVVGWTGKKLPTIKQFTEQIGFKADELWSGVIDSKNSWIVRYQRNLPSENLESL